MTPRRRARTPKTSAAAERASPHALDLDRYIPAYFTFLAGKISASASATYRPRFGVGITDWRIMALLAAEPWISPGRICTATGLDKAAVSRSVHDIARAGLVEVLPDSEDQRRQVVALTRKGLALHDEIVKLAIAREEELLQGFTREERRLLLEFLMRLQAKVRNPNAGRAGDAR